MSSLVHLTASPFYGGPERQLLGLAERLRPEVRSVFLSFAEAGNARAFLDEAARRGFDAQALDHDTPHFRAAIAELVDRLRELGVEVLFCHGYKAGLLGRIAARRAGIPVVAVSRGWTYESLKVRGYELLDRINLRWMDRVVCVSQGQAKKVRRAGVSARKVVVIPNAIDAARFESPDPAARAELEGLFPRPVRRIVGAVGRLSPEKGFSVLVDAAAQAAQADANAGFVLFGDGTLRPALAGQIAARGLAGRFVLAGFRPDLDRLLPALDLLVQSSYTEGMPNVVLEACAAGVPVVATAVGGTPEIVTDGVDGVLVPSGDAMALARSISRILGDDSRRRELGRQARRNARDRFTFAAQAAEYRRLLSEIRAGAGGRAEPTPRASQIDQSNGPTP
jgi:glycosyltransferase involved in cell wall biosynthesis